MARVFRWEFGRSAAGTRFDGSNEKRALLVRQRFEWPHVDRSHPEDLPRQHRAPELGQPFPDAKCRELRLRRCVVDRIGETGWLREQRAPQLVGQLLCLSLRRELAVDLLGVRARAAARRRAGTVAPPTVATVLA